MSVMLSTDLSTAYDTVDHNLLCHKLEHYGIRGDELELIRSYLSDISQFVLIDGATSDIIKKPTVKCHPGFKKGQYLLLPLHK